MPRAYSHSAIENFRGCPKRYAFKYVEKAEVPRRVTADNYLGSAVHLALARLYTEASHGTLVPLEDIIKLYLRVWEKPEKSAIVVRSEYRTVDSYIERGRKMLEAFYRKYQPFNDGKLLGSEMTIKFRLAGTPFELTSRVDRLVKRENGTLEICDYKTGQQMPQGYRDPRFYRQMGLYQLAVKDKFPSFERIEVAQHFVYQDEIIRHTMTSEELELVEEELRSAIVAIKEATRLERFETSEGGHCSYCEYQHLCPAKRHRLQLEAESGEGAEEMTPAQHAAELADKYISVNQRHAELTAEKKALKESLVQAVRELEVERLYGKQGSVRVSIKNDEKFITRTGDRERFAELTALARQLGLDDYFELNTRSLMKEVYKKQSLPKNRHEQLSRFVIPDNSATVTVKRDEEPQEED